MKQIASFFTIFWVIYFPTCIAYNDLPNFSSIDEVMTIILIVFTFMKKGSRATNRMPWHEFTVFLLIITLYIIYSLMRGINIPHSVYLDAIQWLRPFSVIYCTWILNPRFSKRQKKAMLFAMVLTLFSWILYHPETLDTEIDAEFPVLGQLAICTGMSWILFTENTKKNKYIALMLVFIGLLAPKFKFTGEVICFIYMIFIAKTKFNFKSPKTIFSLTFLISAVLVVTWTRFDTYYVSGFDAVSGRMARPETYRTSLLILKDYFPFGPGMGTFATAAAAKDYCYEIYHKYDLDTIWGLTGAGGFVSDAFYPALAEFGIVGIWFFFVFWKRRVIAFTKIIDMKYYCIAFIAFFCLAIEQTADSSFLSGKGMGYCMLLALCLNANRNMENLKTRKKQQEDTLRPVDTSHVMGME